MDTLKKIMWPLIFILLGLILLSYSVSSGQNSLFLMASLAVLSVGIIAAVSTMDLLNKTMRTALVAVLALASLGLSWLDYKVIKDPLEFTKERNYRYTYVIQNLKDIRQAQMGYKTKYGKFAGEVGQLVKFLKSDTILQIKTNGTVPDGFTLQQALDSGRVTKDTFNVPAAEFVFNDKYLSDRKVPFVFDSLAYVPFTRSLFKVESGVIERGKVKVPVFLVTDSEPYDKNMVLMVGSLTEPTTSGNWGE